MATSRVTLTQPGRIIFGLMTSTMVFSLIGNEIATVPNKPGEPGFGAAIVPVNAAGSPVLSPFKIIFGGTIATSLLILISHAGEAGEQFGVGVATVAFVTAALVYGKPVWDAANTQFGSTPTKPVAGSTPTAPTVGATATTSALLSAA